MTSNDLLQMLVECGVVLLCELGCIGDEEMEIGGANGFRSLEEIQADIDKLESEDGYDGSDIPSGAVCTGDGCVLPGVGFDFDDPF